MDIMDCPVTIIFSELLPLFGLDATAICALKCTCKGARDHILEPAPMPQTLRPVDFYDFPKSYVIRGGEMVWHSGTLYLIDTPFIKEVKHQMCLTRARFIWIRFMFEKQGGTSKWRRTQKIISRRVADSCFTATPDKWARGDTILLAGGKFYKITSNITDVLPYGLSDHAIRVRFNIHHNNTAKN